MLEILSNYILLMKIYIDKFNVCYFCLLNSGVMQIEFQANSFKINVCVKKKIYYQENRKYC